MKVKGHIVGTSLSSNHCRGNLGQFKLGLLGRGCLRYDAKLSKVDKMQKLMLKPTALCQETPTPSFAELFLLSGWLLLKWKWPSFRATVSCRLAPNQECFHFNCVKSNVISLYRVPIPLKIIPSNSASSSSSPHHNTEQPLHWPPATESSAKTTKTSSQRGNHYNRTKIFLSD